MQFKHIIISHNIQIIVKIMKIFRIIISYMQLGRHTFCVKENELKITEPHAPKSVWRPCQPQENKRSN